MITQKELKKVLKYNKETGLFYWRINIVRKIKKGAIAGHTTSYGYVAIGINKKLYRAHSLAWLYTKGEFPKFQIDHINRKRKDNRICNLRDIPQSLNTKNRSLNRNNTSGYSGVVFNKKSRKWIASIKNNYKYIYLGSFEFKDEAIKTRKKAEQKYFKSKLNN